MRDANSVLSPVGHGAYVNDTVCGASSLRTLYISPRPFVLICSQLTRLNSVALRWYAYDNKLLAREHLLTEVSLLLIIYVSVSPVDCVIINIWYTVGLYPGQYLYFELQASAELTSFSFQLYIK